MYDRGYLAIGSLDEAKLVRQIDKDVEIALLLGWQERSSAEKIIEAANFGCRFVQPIAEFVTAESFALCKKLNLRDTVFFADSATELERLKNIGATGVLTNKIDTL